MTSESMSWTESDRSSGRSLPSAYFYDPEVFKQERSSIFLRSWHLIAHINDLRSAGDFVTDDILDQSVIVLRAVSGELNAFHNVCQHRGNRLIDKRRGRSPAITCGYHAWTYALDGRLRGAPHTDCLTGFQKANWGLRKVRLEVLGSFVYVNLNSEATPLKDLAPGAEEQLRQHLPDLERLTLLDEVDVPVAANWKVIQENSIEGYHFDLSGPAHKQLVDLVDYSGYRLEAHGSWWTYIAPPRNDLTRAYGVPLMGARWQTDGFFNLGFWPNSTIYAFPYADLVGTFIMKPTGPETSCLRFGYYGVEGRASSDLTKACMRWMNEELGPEDIRLNASNQKGLHSLGFDRGRYLVGDNLTNHSEHLVRHFHELCYRALSG